MLQQPFDIVHQPVVIDIQPVPFHHGELRAVYPSSFVVAEYFADLEDVPGASGQQALHMIFR